MESKASNEKKDDLSNVEIPPPAVLTSNIQKPTISKKMIFQTETFPQSPVCSNCRKNKCECKKIVLDTKNENDTLHASTSKLIFSKFEKEKGEELIGNKRRPDILRKSSITNEKTQQSSENVDLRQKNIYDPNILDLNMLYNTVSPPSELNEELPDGEDSDSHDKKIRKSTRMKKEKTHILQILHCHQCRKSDTSANMLSCTNPICREAYCIQCLKKYFSRVEGYTESSRLKMEEERKDWICYICKGKCLCKVCNKNSERSESVKDVEKSSEGRNPKKNLHQNTIPDEEEKKQNVVKIDDYLIYENVGPEEDESENSMLIDDENDEEFTEKSKKNDKKRFTTKLFSKKKEKILPTSNSKFCLICTKDKFASSEWISLKSIEEFLNYLKRHYETETSLRESEEYKKNKESYYEYSKNFHKHYNNDYVFKSVKYICRQCFILHLNQKNGFDNLFTSLHIQIQSNVGSSEKKEEQVSLKNHSSQEKKSVFQESNKHPHQIQTNTINKNSNSIPQTTISFNKSNPEQINYKNSNDMQKKDFKQIEALENVELNSHNDKKNDLSKIIDMIKPSSSSPPTNPLLKAISLSRNQNTQNTSQSLNTTSLGNNNNNNNQLLNQIINNNPPNLTSLLNNSLPNITNSNNTSLNVNNLMNLVQGLQNSQINSQGTPNSLLSQLINGSSNSQLLNSSGLGQGSTQPSNLNNITGNISRLVEIISQYNQKHLNQNASMLSNINNLVNTMSSIVPGENKQSAPGIKKEGALGDSIKDCSIDKKDNKCDNHENPMIDPNTGEEKKDISNLVLNFESTKSNLSSYMFNVLDELKKQIYSIQYYSLVQKLFISYIFKNLDIFIEQLASNQSLSSLTSNPLFRQIPGIGNYDSNLNNLSDQLGVLKKLADNLASNQANNSILGNPNIEELGNMLGGNPNINQLTQLLNNSSLNLGGPNSSMLSGLTSLLNLPNQQNLNNQQNQLTSLSGQLNNMNNLNNLKNPIQAINKLFNKDQSHEGNISSNQQQNNSMNQLSSSVIPNNNQTQNIFGSQNSNMIEQLLKGIKGQPVQNQGQSQQGQNQGQIIMPINIETNSTNIIQNPANQMYNQHHQQSHPQINSNNLSNLGSNIPLYMSMSNMLGQQIPQNQNFSQNNLLSNPNLMNLLLQQGNGQMPNPFQNQNNQNNFK